MAEREADPLSTMELPARKEERAVCKVMFMLIASPVMSPLLYLEP